MEQNALSPRADGESYQADSGAIPEPTVTVRMKEAAQSFLRLSALYLRIQGFFVDSGKKELSAMQKKTVRLVLISLLSAIAFVLMMLEFPIFAAIPGLQHLKLDFGDVPAALAGALLSPGVGVVVELIKNLLELLVRGIGSQMGFGNLMNLLVGCAYVVPFALFYKRFSGRFHSRAACLTLAGVIASLIMIVIGAAGNYLIAPLFFRYFLHTELTGAVLLTAVGGATALNAVKGVLVTAVMYPLLAISEKYLMRYIKPMEKREKLEKVEQHK